MAWPSIRAFLGIPERLTGRGVTIAVVDGTFAGHPDISDGAARRSHIVLTGQTGARPEPTQPTLGPWPAGAHGLWTAAAAGGSGAASGGAYQGAAPEADLLLTAGYLEGRDVTLHQRQLDTLRWLRDHWRHHQVRAVQTAIRGSTGSGLLPWQTEPLRIACEQLWDEGLLVVVSSGNNPDCVARIAEAAAPSALTVGGVVVQPSGVWRDAIAYHGCRGTTFEQKWTPDVLAPAENLVLPFLEEADADERTPSGYLRMDGGTSCAGPIVLGAAACVWQAHSDWSALQVRTALVRTARRQPGWSALRAGLIDVEAAARWPADPTPTRTRTPYRRYIDWRDRASATRIAAARASDDAEAVEALLSFLPDQVSDEVAAASAGLLQRGSPWMRTAALCVLAAQTDHVSAELLRPHLADTNVHVRAAALGAVRAAPHVRDPLLPQVRRMLTDTSPDLCQAAAELAEDMGAVQLVDALVDGLEVDVRRRWPTCFNARTRALEHITGTAFRPRHEWRTGQPVFDDRWWLAHEGVAANWRAWQAR
jgi:hypothetical protein